MYTISDDDVALVAKMVSDGWSQQVAISRVAERIAEQTSCTVSLKVGLPEISSDSLLDGVVLSIPPTEVQLQGIRALSATVEDIEEELARAFNTPAGRFDLIDLDGI
jgi:hypothetical protein